MLEWVEAMGRGRRSPRRGGILTMERDFSALFYVLVAILLVAKFYVGSCGTCG
jgi:hypothetical protein